MQRKAASRGKRVEPALPRYRRQSLFQEYEQERRRDPDAHSSPDSVFVEELFRIATPAKPGHHYLYQSEAENAAYLSNPQRFLTCVIDDATFVHGQPPGSTRLFIEELTWMDPTILIEIQDPTVRCNQMAVQKLTVSDVLRRWHSGHRINMLDMKDVAIGPLPRGIRDCNTILSEAIERSSTQGLGKRKEGPVATDITSCVQFRLCSAVGAVSRWHVDNLDVWTHVYFYGEDSDTQKRRDSVVKYWGIIPMHLHPPEMRKRILDDFAHRGQDFVARPEYLPVVISLVSGQVILMPPWAMYCVLSLTKCYGRDPHPCSTARGLGGMWWNIPSVLMSTFRVSRWESSPTCGMRRDETRHGLV